MFRQVLLYPFTDGKQRPYQFYVSYNLLKIEEVRFEQESFDSRAYASKYFAIMPFYKIQRIMLMVSEIKGSKMESRERRRVMRIISFHILISLGTISVTAVNEDFQMIPSAYDYAARPV